MIPRRRRFSDMSEDPIISRPEHRKQQKLDKNAHFDHMIQSMSVVNSDRRQRKVPHRSTSELSFIKKTNTPSLSHSSKESSPSRRTCNPLPQWLVNTFMTLSKKNPLRLLLPPEGSDILHTQTETIAQPIDVSATGPLFAFNLPEPNRIQAPNSECLTVLPQTTLINDDNQESLLEPLPFSTPGPGSLLGSSVASNTALSLPIPKKHLSPVTYANETHNDSDLPSNRSHTPVYSSDCLFSDSSVYDPCFETFAMDEVSPSWNSSMIEEDCQPLFTNIYNTPGPRYCAPRPVHFDSPFEDPMSSNNLSGYEIDYDSIDFRWKPFDRKNLVVPDRFQKPIYSATEPTYAVKPGDGEINMLNSHISPASSLLSISPTPFRFPLPLESDISTPIPESKIQNAVQKPSTPKKSLYFAVPGVYISPLDENRKAYDTAAVKKHASELYPTGHRNDDAGNGGEQANSQASNDSIESWEGNL